jgi:hypothetical protein
MSDYTKSTNFATKDNLSSGNALKIVKGTEIDTEFNNIAIAIATKADLASPTFTGTPTLPTGTTATTQSFGNSSTAIATTAFVQAALAAMYPVGSIYTNASSSTNPATLLGFGTWTAFGAGQVMIGTGTGGGGTYAAGATGGSKDAITVSHTHTATSTVTDSGHNHFIAGSGSSNSTELSASNYMTASGNRGGGVYGYSLCGESPTASVGLTNTKTTGITVATTNDSTGSSGTNANLQPYIVVYMWQRTA